MLFRAVDTYLTINTTPKILPHTRYYVDTLNTQRQIITARYQTAVGDESKIVVLLRHILANADIPNLMRSETDLSCYVDQVAPIVLDLNTIFDSVTNGLSYVNTAIKQNSPHTQEYYIPVSCEDPTTDLPFEQDWSAWSLIKPLRLVDIDSTELTFNTYQDQITFSKIYPTRAVFTLDVVALVLQYRCFLKSDFSAIDEPEYIHRYVLVHLLEDLQNLWLGNVYNTIIARVSTDTIMSDKDLTSLSGDPYYGYTGSSLSSAIQELVALARSCKIGRVNPSVLLQSLPLSTGTLTEYLKTLLITTTFNPSVQSQWMEYLRDIRWMDLVYNVSQLQPDYVTSRNLNTALKRDIPLILNTRFWTHTHNQSVRDFIEADVKQRLSNLT